MRNIPPVPIQSTRFWTFFHRSTGRITKLQIFCKVFKVNTFKGFN